MTQNNSATLDNDPQETREWLDSLESVLTVEGRPRAHYLICLLYTSPSPRDRQKSRMPSSA